MIRLSDNLFSYIYNLLSWKNHIIKSYEVRKSSRKYQLPVLKYSGGVNDKFVLKLFPSLLFFINPKHDSLGLPFLSITKSDQQNIKKKK